jgi:hypothetical protein
LTDEREIEQPSLLQALEAPDTPSSATGAI